MESDLEYEVNRSELLIHRTPSVGSIVNKIIAINPELGSSEIIAIVRAATQVRVGDQSEFGLAETVDGERALELARATVRPN